MLPEDETSKAVPKYCPASMESSTKRDRAGTRLRGSKLVSTCGHSRNVIGEVAR